ncbi:hypothetical protein SAMN05216498_0226 [Tenuibacillus multivorans]|uniref:Uncharacterized protein n=1 Tax=Tenuibacillus multivorans TaxID=237069 RepID=A0A1H0FEU9_9BACI|nr:hypothetical protein SAMN05216498_0226 [Tenuibacillus multivorans]
MHSILTLEHRSLIGPMLFHICNHIVIDQADEDNVKWYLSS